MNTIYMDNAATTPINEKIHDEVVQLEKEIYGNPSSIHSVGKKSSTILNNSRKIIANIIKSNPEDIIFTSGGSEANNLAIKGIAFSNVKKGRHIITTKIEHPSVLNTCKWLEGLGFKVTYLDVDKHGFVSTKDLIKNIRKDTILISIMYVNNEIGVIQKIKELSDIAAEHNIPFHTDAVQAFPILDIDLSLLNNVTMMSVSGHKFNAQKGTGFLYTKIKDLTPLIHGGGQEFGLRSGTENVMGIYEMSCNIENLAQTRHSSGDEIQILSGYFIEKLKKIKGLKVRINRQNENYVKNIVSVTFPFDSEVLVEYLNQYDICVSSGSACSSKDKEPSHVLKAIKLSDKKAESTVRFSFGKHNTTEEIDYVIEKIKEFAELLK